MTEKRLRTANEPELGFIDEGPNDTSIRGQRFGLQVKLPALFEEKSEFQLIQVFESVAHGRVLVLDGVVQMTDEDEFAYHEMLVHVPLFAHGGKKKRILLIGAGDGGALRELCKHETVESITHVEIDKLVVEMSKRLLPHISSGALEDKRVSLKITDGLEFLKTDKAPLYDIAIVDSSDPTQGPNGTLFGEDFYQLIRNRLDPVNGILCFQAEHQWLHRELVETLAERCRKIFPISRYYFTQVPTYPGGQIGFFICGNCKDFTPQECSISKAPPSFVQHLKYYTPEIHSAAFTLPAFVRKYLKEI